nr:hypothetical protein [Tanacetum cinerariifolium]
SAKRSLVLVIATSLNFIVMQPPLPSSWTYHSELIRDAQLEIKFELASLMREKVNERSGLRHSQSGQSNNSNATIPTKMRFMQQHRVSTVPAFTINRMAAEGAWMPVVRNTYCCWNKLMLLDDAADIKLRLLEQSIATVQIVSAVQIVKSVSIRVNTVMYKLILLVSAA